MIKKTYLIYVHNLRGLAILIIVAIHSRMALFGGANDSSLNRILSVFLDNGTIIFVIISGFLFHHVFIDRFEFKKYIANKSKYVLLPYLLASIIPILDKLFFDNNIPWLTPSLDSKGPIVLVFYMLFSGKHFGPFWFIPMITLFYLLAPILRKVNTKKFYIFIFPIIFAVGLFTYQFGYYSTIVDSFIFYLPIYLFGMLLSEYRLTLFKHQRWVFSILILLYVGITVLELMQILTTPKLVGFHTLDAAYFIFNPAKLRFMILAVILLIAFHRLEFVKFKFLRVLGDYSFGIYFVHLFFIIIFQKTVQFYQLELPKNLILFLVLSFFTVSASILFVWIIKIIFKDKSRLIIGS